MNSDLDRVISELTKTPMVKDRYMNLVDLTGFILRKPKFIKSQFSEMESACFIVYQPKQQKNGIKMESFNCSCFDTQVVKQMKEVENVLFVDLRGQLRFSKRTNSVYVSVHTIHSKAEVDIKLAPAYVGKTND